MTLEASHNMHAHAVCSENLIVAFAWTGVWCSRMSFPDRRLTLTQQQVRQLISPTYSKNTCLLWYLSFLVMRLRQYLTRRVCQRHLMYVMGSYKLQLSITEVLSCCFALMTSVYKVTCILASNMTCMQLVWFLRFFFHELHSCDAASLPLLWLKNSATNTSSTGVLMIGPWSSPHAHAWSSVQLHEVGLA